MNKNLPFFSLIILVVVLSIPSGVWGDGLSGKKIFTARRCAACHRVKRPRAPLSRADFLREKGPDLWYAGNKFKKGWLRGWLSAPWHIRPLAYNSLTEKNPGDHPRLPADEAGAVEAYLMGLKAPGLMRQAGIRPGVNVRGRIVFIKKFACYGCHLVKVRGTVAGGLSGPSLEGARDRLNPEWIYAFLTGQRAFEPVGRMPVYEGLASEVEMKALAAYVAGLE